MKPFVIGPDGQAAAAFDVRDLVAAARANCPLPAGTELADLYQTGLGLLELSALELGELFLRVLALSA